MAKKKRKKAKPKLQFRPKPVAYKYERSGWDPDIKLAVWGIIAIVILIVLILYFTGLL